MVVGGSTSHRYTENHTSRVEVIDLNYIKRCKLKSNYKLENLSNSTTIMIIGGAKYTNNSFFGQAINATWFYNVKQNKWHPGPDLKYPRFGHSCGVIGNKITKRHIVIVAGGMHLESNETNNIKQPIQSVEILKFFETELKWEIGPYLPKSVVFGSMIENHKGVYLIGGLTHDQHNNLTVSEDIFFLKRNSDWKRMRQKLKIGTSNHISMLVPNKIVQCS